MINTTIKKMMMKIHDSFTDLYDAIDIGSNENVDLSSIHVKTKMLNFSRDIECVFPSIKCTRFVITPNADKEFFGNIVVVKNILRENQKDYEILLETDYRIFNSNYISPDQALMYILHDIYNIIQSCVSEEIYWIEDELAIKYGLSRVALDEYKQLKNTREYALVDTQLKTYTLTYYCSDSIFGKDENQCKISDTLIAMFNYLHSGYEDDKDHIQFDSDKIYQDFNALFAYIKTIRNYTYNISGCNYNTITLEWFILQVKFWNVKNKDIVRELRNHQTLCGSQLISTMLNVAIEKLGYSSNAYMTNVSIQEASFFNRIKKGGMKTLEEDLYEFSMRVKNISDQNDAILLMRQINSRISIISDYLETENLNELEVRRWEGLYAKYLDLRDTLTKKPVYSRKMYGLFSDYNALMAMQAQDPAAMQNIMY